MKRSKILILAVVLICSLLTGCAKKNYYNPDTNSQTEDTNIVIKAITLEQSEMSLNIGEAAMLNATVSPGDAKDFSVKWSSSDEKVLTVSKQGVVFAKKEGKATVTVSDEAGKIKALCEVKVNTERKAIIIDNVPTQALGGEFYKVSINFENCAYPSLKVIADCGGGNIRTDSETIKLGGKEEQYFIPGKATISFAVSSHKQVTHLRILCFDNGDLFDCKEYNVSLMKNEPPTADSSNAGQTDGRNAEN